jgi:hypothetical protein
VTPSTVISSGTFRSGLGSPTAHVRGFEDRRCRDVEGFPAVWGAVARGACEVKHDVSCFPEDTREARGLLGWTHSLSQKGSHRARRAGTVPCPGRLPTPPRMGEALWMSTTVYTM